LGLNRIAILDDGFHQLALVCVLVTALDVSGSDRLRIPAAGADDAEKREQAEVPGRVWQGWEMDADSHYGREGYRIKFQ